jgi:hypothetical protein
MLNSFQHLDIKYEKVQKMLKRVQHKKDATAIGAIKERSVSLRTISIRFTRKQSNLRILAYQNFKFQNPKSK